LPWRRAFWLEDGKKDSEMSDSFDPFALPSAFEPFTGRALEPGRPTTSRPRIGAKGTEPAGGPGRATIRSGGGHGDEDGLAERLTLVEAELVSLRLRLETVDQAVTDRLSDQTARLLLAVADLVGGRGPAPLPERKKPPRKARIVW
jgi:hypothetical protein